MKKIILVIVVLLLALFTFKYCDDKKGNQIVLKEHSALIQKQIKSVSKLVVTEGHFSEIFNYKNSKAIFGDYFSAEKKALVVVNAEVSIAYDLSQLDYELDEVNKVLTIKSIPKEEIKINPDLEYYDIQQELLNPFEAKDYNVIKETINTSLMKKIEASNMKTNAKERLISELSKFYILTNSLGWTLEYNETPITTLENFKGLKL